MRVVSDERSLVTHVDVWIEVTMETESPNQAAQSDIKIKL